MSNIEKYYIKNNIVYLLKETYKRDYLLKLSPPFKGVDRRIFIIKKSDLNGYKLISSQKAWRIVNKEWKRVEEEWIFNGKIYKVFNYKSPNSTYYDTFGNIVKVENSLGIYRLCYYQGKICLLSKDPGQDRVTINKCKTIENKIYIGRFIKWTSPKNCKVIYEVLSNGDLKII